MPSVLVTGARHIDALDAALPAHLDAVTNNAGIVVARAVLPKLRQSRGRVIFISSVEEALTARNPKARYLVGLGNKVQVAFMRNTLAAVRDRIVAKVFGVPGRA